MKQTRLQRETRAQILGRVSVPGSPLGITLEAPNVLGRQWIKGDDPARRSLQIPGVGQVVTARFPDGKAPDWREGVATRRVLAEWMTSADNPHLARTLVNRMWSQFFGRGLVEPLDEVNERRAPVSSLSTPHSPLTNELLDLIAERFIAQGGAR